MPRTGEFLAWIRAATRAPSLANTQPWLFELGRDELTLRLDPARLLPVADPQGREAIISLGCALENLAVAARHDGEEIEVLSATPERGIRVRTHRTTAAGGAGIYRAIFDRQTNRRPYDAAPLEAQVVQTLEAVELEPGVSMRLVTGRKTFESWASLVEEADRAQRSSSRFRRELLRWQRFNDREVAATLDGLSVAAAGEHPVPRWFARAVYPVLKAPTRHALSEAALIESASALLLLSSPSDGPEDWLATGRSLERLLLRLTVLGVQHAYANQPCQMPQFRRRLAQLAGTGGERPQLLLRLGHAPPLPRSPRRPLEDVVVTAPERGAEPTPLPPTVG